MIVAIMIHPFVGHGASRAAIPFGVQANDQIMIETIMWGFARRAMRRQFPY
jgi:hypothetical protein